MGPVPPHVRREAEGDARLLRAQGPPGRAPEVRWPGGLRGPERTGPRQGEGERQVREGLRASVGPVQGDRRDP